MIRQYRKQWLKWHNGYERTARIIFQRTFKEIAKDIPFDRMSVGTYKSYLQTHVSKEKIFDSYVKVYSEVGTKHGKRVGVQINKQINQKNFNVDGFLNEFQKTLINFLVTNEGSRITTVRQSYIQFLTQIMTKGIADGKTISIIATDMTRLIKSRNFYRWQALRIARTETTAASNYAATVSSSVSGVLMDKVWISALDERTRQGKFNHLEMNQKRVPLDKAFNVSGEKLMFPGDPKGSGGNVINCRCSVAQVVRRDSDGNIMRIEDKVPVRDSILSLREENIRRYEQSIKNQKFESAGLYNSKGDLLFKKDGKARSVKFTDSELKEMKGNYLTHNHPLDESFSPEDIHVLAYHQLREIRAVTIGGRSFSMKMKEGVSFNKKEFTSLKSTITRLSNKEQKELSKRYFSKEITLEQYKQMAYNNVWVKFSEIDKYKDIFTYKQF